MLVGAYLYHFEHETIQLQRIFNKYSLNVNKKMRTEENQHLQKHQHKLYYNQK